jgi:D-methionine transport system ATP-binding protein
MTHPIPQFRLQQVSLTTAIGRQSLLQDISCEMGRGDRVALVGPSGAGKTSLLRLLNRLTEISQGQIFYEDQEIRQIPVFDLRQQVVLVPQESKLLGMTVREALTYPLTLRGLARSTIQQRLSTWVEQLHIPQEWLERTEVQLSVGQRQLVAIARALVIQPKVLLLDEPTSSLDGGRGAHVLHVLQELAQHQQMTIIMANHQLDLAAQFCDRVLYLHQGKLEQDLLAEQTNWLELKENLIRAEAQLAQEWE